MCGRHALSPDPLAGVGAAATFQATPVQSGTSPDQQAVQSATTEADALKALRKAKSSPPILIS